MSWAGFGLGQDKRFKSFQWDYFAIYVWYFQYMAATSSFTTRIGSAVLSTFLTKLQISIARNFIDFMVSIL